MRPAQPARKLRLAHLRHLLWAVAAFPAVVALHAQITHWVDIPIWDEWDTPGVALLKLKQGTLTWADLFAQHNESRKFFPRLIYMALELPFGWDVRHGMVLTFLALCAASVFALRYLRTGGTKGDARLLGTWTIVNLLLFAPSQYENLLCGNAFEILIPVLSVFGVAAVNLSNRPLWMKAALSSLLATVATYSFAHGMILWALAIPVPNSAQLQQRRWSWTLLMPFAGYVVVAATAAGSYFVGYRRPDIAPAAARLEQAPQVLEFFLVWLGALFRSPHVSSYITGSIVAVVVLCEVIAALAHVMRDRGSWSRYYPWLLLLAFSIGSGIITAVGRLNQGIETVFAPGFDGIAGFRYNLTAVFVYVAAVGLLHRLYEETIRSVRDRRRWFLVGTTISIVLLCWAWMMVWTHQASRLPSFQKNRLRALDAVTWIEVIPRNPDVFAAYPYIEGFAARVEQMKRLGLVKLPPISRGVKQAVASAPAGDGEAGAIETAKLEGAHQMRIIGWARDPRRNSKPGYVVLGSRGTDGVYLPFTITKVGQRRPDLAHRLNADAKALPSLGFNPVIDVSKLPPGASEIQGWAVDQKLEIAFPLAGAAALHRPVD
ncbi:MAG: hypothetical protein H0W20_04460 [Chthoniobacterales bacterium]|nr:hypothetical protein [Chthoniobacterales bacterium]